MSKRGFRFTKEEKLATVKEREKAAQILGKLSEKPHRSKLYCPAVDSINLRAYRLWSGLYSQQLRI